tara:strand:+ start:58 stop:351 length:294 start_codon:yes stop_codon:yes gene_type:complete
MSKKIKTHNVGDCVEVSTWDCCDEDGFFKPGRAIGLVLEAELVEMDGESGLHDPSQEWMYRVVLPDGRVTECWDYEVKHVNSNTAKYNNVSHPTKRN